MRCNIHEIGHERKQKIGQKKADSGYINIKQTTFRKNNNIRDKDNS